MMAFDVGEVAEWRVSKSPKKSPNAGLDFGKIFCQSRIVLSRIYSAAVYGVDAYEVEIEVNAARGDPNIVIVGLPDAAVKESRDRVTTAISNSGYFWPRGRTTINLAPADIKKEGPSFDLPIALGMIAAAEEIEGNSFEQIQLCRRAGAQWRGAAGERRFAGRAGSATRRQEGDHCAGGECARSRDGRRASISLACRICGRPIEFVPRRNRIATDPRRP